jgi:Cu-Zn family superoxide dismutase
MLGEYLMRTHNPNYRSIHGAARIACVAAATSLLTACGTLPPAGPGAEATLESRSGSTVSGTVSFFTIGQKIRVDANVAGLTPGTHGFHVHDVGDCSAPDASSAKGHFNPAGNMHGHHDSAEHHAGDMPNLIADGAGRATLSAELNMLLLTEGPNGILKRSVVIHADPDDYTSQPAGNSGKRVACGVIRATGGSSSGY